MAALSTGEHAPNPHVKVRHAAALTKASRAYARTQAGSRRREKAKRRLARLHHLEALRRATGVHRLTRRLAGGYAEVAVEDLDVIGMTASARGTRRKPGRNVKATRERNRTILDIAPGEIRRQLAYKAPWYGGLLTVLDRDTPVRTTCSSCGTVKATPPEDGQEFHCTACGLSMARDANAATVIARIAAASDRGEALNARGVPVSPSRPRVGRRGASMREGQPPGGSP